MQCCVFCNKRLTGRVWGGGHKVESSEEQRGKGFWVAPFAGGAGSRLAVSKRSLKAQSGVSSFLGARIYGLKVGETAPRRTATEL